MKLNLIMSVNLFLFEPILEVIYGSVIWKGNWKKMGVINLYHHADLLLNLIPVLIIKRGNRTLFIYVNRWRVKNGCDRSCLPCWSHRWTSCLFWLWGKKNCIFFFRFTTNNSLQNGEKHNNCPDSSSSVLVLQCVQMKKNATCWSRHLTRMVK